MKNIIYLMFLLSIVLALSNGVLAETPKSTAQIIAELQQEIARLQAMVLALQQQQSGGDFNRNLFYGLTNDPDVRRLQTFLSARGLFSGPITGGFFSLTQTAVKRFQASQNIQQTGYFGPLSRASANKLQAPTISAIDGPTLLKATETANWTVRANDPNGASLVYGVDWGDGIVSPFTTSNSISHKYSASGMFTMRVSVKNVQGLTASYAQAIQVDVSTVILPLEIKTISNLNGTVNSPLQATFTVSGGIPAYRWDASGTPDGLQIISLTDDRERTLKGTPTKDGSYSFTIKITDGSNKTITKNFTIVIAKVVTTALNVITPNGGEIWIKERVMPIRWSIKPTGSTDVYLRNISSGGLIIVKQNTGNAQNILWPISSITPTGQYVIRVYRADGSGHDESDGNFRIDASSTAPVISDIFPRTGMAGDKITIIGNQFMATNTVAFGASEVTVSGTNVSADKRALTVTVPTGIATITPALTVRNSLGTSNGVPFGTVVPDLIKITKPSATETWIRGTSHAITWTSLSRVTNFGIQLRGSAVYTLTQNLNSRSFNWTVPQSISTGVYRLRILNADNQNEYIDGAFDLQIN